MNYPPYAALAVLLVKGRVFERARAGAEALARKLRRLAGKNVQVLGPAPAPLERLRGDYRVQVVVKAPNRRDMQTLLAGALKDLDGKSLEGVSLVVDVDPMSTL